MRNAYIILLTYFITLLTTTAQTPPSFGSVTRLEPVHVATNTADKPQSKVWMYANKWWAVLSDSDGSHVWRLDGTTWSRVITLTTNTYAKADCKVEGNTVHILLHRGTYNHYLASIEFNTATNTYQLWKKRPTLVNVPLEPEAETATIDIDSRGRMWLASDASNSVNVRWSDSPYDTWSAPITLATGIKVDDISAIVALPGKIGVLWSDQTKQRFGFRTHLDKTDPTVWTADEIPASQSAENVGMGMADDHINVVVSKDGTLYCAVKTEFDKPGYAKIALLVRRPSGKWDKLHKVTDIEGTRPVVTLNEELGLIRIIYTDNEHGGNILYKESPLSSLAFCNTYTLLSGNYNYATSQKNSYRSQILVLATDESSSQLRVDGVLISDSTPAPEVMMGCEESYKDVLVYPNPFSDRATISFKIEQGGDYTVRLYDARGVGVTHIHSGRAGAGELNELFIDGTSFSRGFYILRLQTAEGVRIAKIIKE